MNKRRVVITGMGCVSCVGNDVASMWDSVVNGKCGLGKVTLFDTTDFKTQIAGEIKGLRAEDYIPAKEYVNIIISGGIVLALYLIKMLLNYFFCLM